MSSVALESISLDHLAPGKTAHLLGLQGGCGFVSRLATLGFTVGAPISMVQNFGRGPLIVMVRNSRVALGRGEAAKVSVRL